VQWVQAKLWLQASRLEPARALLAQLGKKMPAEISTTNRVNSLEESLFVPGHYGDYGYGRIAPGRQVLAEMGALRLARREFTAALGDFLNAGFWLDAAYVAERVLTTEELKDYVDRHWPAPSRKAVVTPNSDGSDESILSLRDEMNQRIRYLLGRRLTRELRGIEAHGYYPAEWQSEMAGLIAALTAGWDDSRPGPERARALFAAAQIVRTNGMDLLGTEVAPDWHCYEGDFQGPLTASVRTNAGFGLMRASEEEQSRYRAHPADPEAWLHYRYQAAFLAWEAAKLLPDEADETALVLCRAGSWLKYHHPPTADIFYKALVRRCRRTALGNRADELRWFPRLDAMGTMVLPSPPSKETERPTLETPGVETSTTDENAGETPAASLSGEETVLSGTAWGGLFAEQTPDGNQVSFYIVHRGDTLTSISRMFTVADHPVTLEQLLRDNPGIDSARLIIGQKICIRNHGGEGTGDR
jgi:hypothetical protein